MIVLTGAHGLIGSAVFQALSAAGHGVVRLGRDAGCDLVADLQHPEQIRWPTGATVLIHCAGVTDEEFRAAPDLAWQRATSATERMLDGAVAAGIRQFAYISTAHVYGPLVGRLTEASPVDPISSYGIAHRASESLFFRTAARTRGHALVMRPCAVYGPLASLSRFKRWSLIPFSFPKEAVETGEIVLMSSGDQVRNFVSSRQIAAATVRWLANPATLTLNPVGPQNLSVYEFARLCAEEYRDLTGRECRVTRPGGTQQDPLPSLDYDTLHPAHQCGEDDVPLRSHIRDLMRDLLAKGHTNGSA